MKFELNDLHRNTPDEELLKDVRAVAEKLCKLTLTKKEYSSNGNYHADTLTNRFGSWQDVLVLAGLDIKGHNFLYSFSDEDVKCDVRRVAELLHKDTVTNTEYNQYGKYHSTTIMARYGGKWNNVLKMCKLRLNVDRDITNKDLFEEIERIWVLLGRQPTTADIRKGISKYSLNTYSRHFGGWRNAVKAFVEYINSEEQGVDDKAEEVNSIDLNNSTDEIDIPFKHKTKREINPSLRYKVLKRDNFRCCICGASPAKDPSVDLEVDHIIPWSRGGETVMDNLQTLCFKCNRGKSDLM